MGNDPEHTEGFGQKTTPVYDVAIIGGGPAGASAAIYTARAEMRTLVLDKAMSSGALARAGSIANYPGLPEAVSGAALLARMREQAQAFGASFVQAQVLASNLTANPKELFTATGSYQATCVIIATGKLGRKSRVPGEEQFLGRGVSYCATCDAPFFRGRNVAIVGGDEHAVDEALYTTRFAQKIYLLVPGSRPTGPPEQLTALARNDKIEVRLRHSLREVVGDSIVSGIRVAGPDGDEIISVDGVLIFLGGNAPIVDFAQGVLSLTPDGCVISDRDRSTNIPGVYAAGDVTCSYLQQSVVAAADGAIAAMAAEKYVRGREHVRSDWS